jgi:hypothetical protein
MGLTTLPCKKKIVEKPPRNSAGFCGGGQAGLWSQEKKIFQSNCKRPTVKRRRLPLKFLMFWIMLLVIYQMLLISNTSLLQPMDQRVI